MRALIVLIVGSIWSNLSVHTAFAQTKTERASVEWGPDQIDSKDGRFDKVVGHKGEHVYMVVNFRSGPFLRKIDRDHGTVYLKPLPMKVDKAEHELKHVFVVGEKVLVFTTYLDKKDKSESLYLRIFNDPDLTPIGEMRKLATVDAEKRSTKGYSLVRLSPDKQMLLISRKLAYEKDAPERLHLQVLDRDMNPLWDREVEMPHNDENFNVQGMNVADDGTVFLTARMYPDKQVYKELRKDGKIAYTYHLVIVHREEGPPEDHVFDVRDKFLHSLELNFGKEGDILCGGFYGSKGSLDVSGTYFLRLDRATKQISHSSFSEFDRAFITEGMSGKQEAKADREAAKKGEELGLDDLVLRKIIRRDDGGAVLVGEQFQTYVTTSTSTDQRGFTRIQTTTHYIYNDTAVRLSLGQT